MRWPWSSLLLAQAPLDAMKSPPTPFALKSGPDILSPKDMLELPRPGVAVANPLGDLAYVPVSQYSFETRKMNSTIHIISLNSRSIPISLPLLNGGEAFWLSSRTLAHVVSGASRQSIYAISLNYTISPPSLAPLSPVLLGDLPPTPISNFLYDAPSGTLAFSAYVYAAEDGDPFRTSEHDAARAKARSGTSARVYDGGYARHWDEWKTPGRESQVFTVRLSANEEEDGVEKWVLGDEYTSPLKGTEHYVPVEPFGGTDDFDLSPSQLIYTAKDPSLPYAWHTRQNVYIVPTEGGESPRQLTTGTQGATHSPVLSKLGDKAAWLELRVDGYEADRARVMVHDLVKGVLFGITEHWDRSPSSLVFSDDGSTLYALVGDTARVKIYSISVPSTPSASASPSQSFAVVDATLQALTEEHTVTGVQPLPDGRLLFTQSSLTRPNEVFTLTEGKIDRITDFGGKQLTGKNLSPGEEFFFKGAGGKTIQGWVNTPPGFRKGEKGKWPMAFLIHGGPQGAWEDSWSTRWNPNVFAQQGYVVVTVNPTGSTTFGQDLTDAIAEDWGGKPFVDLSNGYKAVLKLYPEIDPERTVAAGASWGGYAINWIAGHPEFGFNFKALVCHDGVFDTRSNGFATDELFFFDHEFGGPPWKSAKLVEKYNPANFVQKWSIPMLIFHGEKDYRLPVTEGIGAYHSNLRMGVPTRLVVFPEENHWVLDAGNSLKWHTELFEWFDKWLN